MYWFTVGWEWGWGGRLYAKLSSFYPSTQWYVYNNKAFGTNEILKVALSVKINQDSIQYFWCKRHFLFFGFLMDSVTNCTLSSVTIFFILFCRAREVDKKIKTKHHILPISLQIVNFWRVVIWFLLTHRTFNSILGSTTNLGAIKVLANRNSPLIRKGFMESKNHPCQGTSTVTREITFYEQGRFMHSECIPSPYRENKGWALIACYTQV